MSIRFNCPSCQHAYRVDSQHAGKKTKCKKCGNSLDIPTESQEEINLIEVEQSPFPQVHQQRPQHVHLHQGIAARREKPQGNGAAMSLGITSLVLGLLALITSWVPFIGCVAIPLGGLGILIGLIGAALSLTTRGRGIGMPIGGLISSTLAIIISITVTGGTAKAVSDGLGSATETFAQEILDRKKDELAELMQQKDEAERNRTLVKSFVINSSMLTWEDFSFTPTFEISVTNGLNVPVLRVFMRGRASSPSRPAPYGEDEFNYSIPGGMNPGASEEWRLSPSFLTDWDRVPKNDPDTIFEVEVIALETPEGRISGELSERQINRIAELQEEIAAAERDLEERRSANN